MAAAALLSAALGLATRFQISGPQKYSAPRSRTPRTLAFNGFAVKSRRNVFASFSSFTILFTASFGQSPKYGGVLIYRMHFV